MFRYILSRIKFIHILISLSFSVRIYDPTLKIPGKRHVFFTFRESYCHRLLSSKYTRHKLNNLRRCYQTLTFQPRPCSEAFTQPCRRLIFPTPQAFSFMIPVRFFYIPPVPPRLEPAMTCDWVDSTSFSSYCFTKE